MYIQKDLVMYVSQNIIAEVCGVDINESYYFIKTANNELTCVLKNYLEPIILTPKILEINGWENDGVMYDFRYKDSLYLLNTEYDEKGNIVSTGVYNNIAEDCDDVSQDDFYLRTVSYVHELQHLLLGLGKNNSIKYKTL